MGYLTIFSLSFFALVKSVYFAQFGLNLFDYGESLHNAVRLLAGGVLYKDVWAIFPPADNYFPALIIGIFGEKLLVLRFAQSLLFSAFVGVLALVVREFLSGKFVALLAIAVIFSVTGVHLLFFNLFFYMALLFVLHFLKQHSYRWIFFSGVVLGTGTLFRYDTGIVTGLTILAVLFLARAVAKNRLNVRELSSAIFLLLVGIALIVVPVGLWLWQIGTLEDFLFLAFVEAPRISRILNPGFSHVLLNSFSRPITYAKSFQLFTLFLYPLFLAIYPSTGVILYQNFKRTKFLVWKDLVIASLLILGILQIPYVLSVVDIGHLIKGGLPALILAIYFLQQGLGIKDLGKVKRAVLLLPLSIFILGNLIISFWWIKYHDIKVDFKQGSVFINSSYLKGTTHPTAKTLSHTVEFIQTHTQVGEYIFTAPYHALLYFLSERKAPSRFNNFLVGYVSEKEEEEVIAEMEEKKVNIVVYDPVNAPHGKRLADYNPKIHTYLMNTFETVETTEEGWLLMKKKE